MDSLGDRMKHNYENRYRLYLTRRTPVIIRLDGKAFHTLTRYLDKPYDNDFMRFMGITAIRLCEELQGSKCAYIQSDEISILLTDFDTLTTDAWFDFNIQKMVSISASIASVKFSSLLVRTALFDSRVFNIPKEDVCNYFIWRQKDWIRNSVQMLAQSHFSQKQLHKKRQADMHEMLYTKGVNWAKCTDIQKNGQFVSKGENGWLLNPAPIFTENRQTIELLLIDTDGDFRHVSARSEDGKGDN